MQKNIDQNTLKGKYKDIGLVIGVAAGAALSLFFAAVLDSPGMIGVGRYWEFPSVRKSVKLCIKKKYWESKGV